MESLAIMISRSTYGRLRELAGRTGDTMADIVDRATRCLEREPFWVDYHAAYAAIQADPSASVDLEGEMESWDSTLADGLQDSTVDGR
jgi:hypothetical protein